MAVIATNQFKDSDEIVALSLNGGRVTQAFRAALFAAASREGVTVNQLVIQSAAERLRAAGARFSGVFTPGDLPIHRSRTPSRSSTFRSQGGRP